MDAVNTVRGCSNCMIEYPKRFGKCPTCGIHQIDTYAKPYWNSMLTEGNVQVMKNDAQDNYRRKKQHFLEDLMRICRIYGMFIEPQHHVHGVYEENYLLVRDLKHEADLLQIKSAI